MRRTKLIIAAALAASVIPMVPAQAGVLTPALAVETGTPDFDADDAPGHDSSADNNIIRTNDYVKNRLEVRTDGDAAPNTTITYTMPPGMYLENIPAYCTGPGTSLTPATLPDPEVPLTATSYLSLPSQVLVCNAGDRDPNSTVSYLFDARIRTEVPHGTSLQPTLSVTSDTSDPVDVPVDPVVVSASPELEFSKNSSVLQENTGYVWGPRYQDCSDGSGRICNVFDVPMLISAPDGGKGYSPITSISFEDNLTPESMYPGLDTNQNWLDAVAAGTAYSDYGANLTLCRESFNFGGYTPDPRYVPGGNTLENSVRDTGDVTCTQPGGPGTPVQIQIDNIDASAYTCPTHARRSGATLPAGQCYVGMFTIRYEIPNQAVEDLGIQGSAGQYTLLTRNIIEDFDGTDLAGNPLDAAANEAWNDYRDITARVDPRGYFDKYFASAPDIPDATPHNGDTRLVPGGFGRESGIAPVVSGQEVISRVYIRNQSGVVGLPEERMTCDTWDPNKLWLSDVYYDDDRLFADDIIPNGEAAWLSGYSRGGRITDPLPEHTIQYAAGPYGEGAPSACGNDLTWYDNPEDVPGNDPAKLAEGIYTAVNKVRMYTAFEAVPATSYMYYSIGQVVADNPGPLGTEIPNWGSTWSRRADTLLGAEAMFADDRTTTEAISEYDPATHSGLTGDRLIYSQAYARISKEVRGPLDSDYGNGVPLSTGGQTVSWRLTPTLSAPVPTQQTQEVIIEDCLPAPFSYANASLAPSSVTVLNAPLTGDLACDTGETHIVWNLGQQVPNVDLPVITIDSTVKLTASPGTYTNQTIISTPGDSAPAATRTDEAQATIQQPAGVKLEKVALTPVREINPVGVDALPNRWSVTMANIADSTINDVRLIDRLPLPGVNGTSTTGNISWGEAVVTGGGPMDLYYTGDPAVVSDPLDPSNDPDTGNTQWCDGLNGVVIYPTSSAGTPCSITMPTGILAVRSGPFSAGDTLSFEVEVNYTGDTAGDEFINEVSASANELVLSIGPAVAPETAVASSISGIAWDDADYDGAQGDAEPRLADVRVTLTGTDSYGNPVTAMTTTAADGSYTFGGLRSGDYSVTFAPSTLPTDYHFTNSNVPADDALDSDANPTTGVVATFTVPQGTAITDVDAGAYTYSPAITISKLINGEENPTVDAGSTLDITFEVTNSGTSPLVNVSVTDSVIATEDITCPQTTLSPGESMTCTATLDAPEAGALHENTATATGDSPNYPDGENAGSAQAEDNASAAVDGTPAITLVKTVAGEDANETPGVTVGAGEQPVTYEVTNTGDTTLANVTITDPDGDLTTTITCPQTTLAPGESMTCTATTAEIPTGGSHSSTATVTGDPVLSDGITPANDPDGNPYDAPEASDPVNTVRPGTPSITVESYINDDDADTTPGAETDGTGTPTYVVTNTGDTTLSDVALNDPNVTGLTCPQTTLAPGESMTCTADNVTIEPGSTWSTTADVTGTPVLPDGATPALDANGEPLSDVTDTDPTNAYTTPVASITIETYVNDNDADDTPGAELPEGDGQLTYTVTNDGNTTLANISVTDDEGNNLTCPQTTLAPGESMTCTADNITLEPGQTWGTTASVTGTPVLADGTTPAATPDGTPLSDVTDTDPTNAYRDANPSITVESYINDDDADTTPGVEIDGTGTPTYVVTNTGDTTLSDVALNDPNVTGLTCPQTILAPGESMVCAADDITLEPGTTWSSTPDVEGTPVLPDGTTPATDNEGNALPPVTDDDPTNTYHDANPSVTIETYVNDDDADDTPGAELIDGDGALTYEVTNTGDTTLANIVVTDGEGNNLTCPQATLAPGESMTCTADNITLEPGQTWTTTADVIGYPVLSDGVTPAVASDNVVIPPVTDDDPTNAYRSASPSITIDKKLNGEDANQSVRLTPGQPMAFTFLVTNTGDTTLINVTVLDDKIDDVTCPQTTLAPGESMTCTASMDPPAQGETHSNTAVAQGQAALSDGTPIIGNDGVISANSENDDANAWVPGTASVTVEKRINGNDADNAPGVETSSNTTMDVTYVVTNTGTTTLTDISLVDETATPSCPKTTLAPGESMTCTAKIPAPGPGESYDAPVSVIATPTLADGTTPALGNDGEPLSEVEDSDPAHAHTPKPLGNLAHTGAELAILAATGAAFTAAGFIVLVMVQRRKRQN